MIICQHGLGKNNWFWQQYFDSVRSAGDISPSIVTRVPLFAREYVNIDRFSERLLIALHYLLTMAPEERVDPAKVDIPWLTNTEKEKEKSQDRPPKKLLVITNHKPDTLIAELWMYPAEGYSKNKAGAFNKMIAPNDSMLLVYDGVSIYEANVEVSATYKMNEQEGYQILIYRNLADELIIFGDTKKDTIYFQKHPIVSFSTVDPLAIELD